MSGPLRTRLVEIGENIRSQDGRATSHPMFVVEQKRRVFGFTSGYSGEYEWYRAGSGDEYSAEGTPMNDWLEARADPWEDDIEAPQELPDGFDEDDWRPGLWSKLRYRDHWEFVTACFTEKSCDDYLRINKHNLGETRIVVYSGWRNQEWQDIREFLADEVSQT